ncbi:hypothetical protein F5Y10DRAFT_288967 [Nemania abortiva]|nr:hypothetical protein F5Y10DRAFT_288967 [Nemania abortiva]
MATAETREEFEGQLFRRVPGSSSYSRHYVLPTARNDPGHGREKGNPNGSPSRSIYATRWARALERCEKTLNKTDYETVAQYDSPEKLLIGLEELQQENVARNGAKPTPLSRLIDQIRPTQRSFQELLTVFVAAMIPNVVSSTFAFGLLYLCVKLCRDRATASRSLEGMVAKIRRRLALMARYSNRISSDENDEFCLTFIDILEDLIVLWSHFVTYIRNHPPHTRLFHEDHSQLEDLVQETISRMDDSLSHLGRLRNLGATGIESQLQRTDLESGVVASASFPISLLPDTRTEHFVGHKDLLVAMHQYFQNKDNEKQELKIYSLCGIGGVGKTEIAMKFSKEFLNEFDAIFWIGAESVDSLQRSFTKVALALGLPNVKVNGDPDHHLTLVHQWLRGTDKSWLLIFDNVEEFGHIERFLPFGCRGSVIITTRYAEQAKPCRRKLSTVEPLSLPDSETLFLKLLYGLPNATDDEQRITQITSEMPAKEKQAIHYLLTQMDGLALGIQQIAALIRYQELVGDIPKFVEKYRRRPQSIHAKPSGIAGHTLATLWEMSFTAVRSNRNSFILLGLISCLQPDEIPKALFLPDDISRVQGELSFCADEDDLDDAIDLLKGLALIERRKDKPSIHRLLQVAFLFQTGLSQGERQQIFDFVSTLVDHAFPAQEKDRQMYDQWTKCRMYIQHARSITTLHSGLRRAGYPMAAPKTFQHLIPACVWHLYECGSEREALEMVEIAISSSSDNENLLHAQLLNTAMINYFKLNDIENARRVLEESRIIREKLMDPQNEELAATYANFGSIELAEGNLDAALEYYQRAQKIRMGLVGAESMQGLDHMCIGRVLFAKGDFEGAVREYKICEQIYSQFGPDHYLQVRINFAWGGMELARGEYSASRALLKRALHILLKQTPNDMKAAATYFKLGCIETELKNYREAMDIFNKGLKIAKLHGEDGLGEIARIIRKQAMVLERCPDSEDLLSLANMQDAEHLRGEAEAILRRLRPSGGLDDEDEDRLFDSLVNPFNR